MEDIDFSVFCKTRSQAQDFSTRIGAIISEIFLVNFKLENSLTEHLGLQKKDSLLIILREKKINTSSGTDLKSFLSKMQDHVNTLPVLSMILAIEPKEKTLSMLSEWFQLNLQKQVLFDLITEPGLIGGAAIAYKGKFLDYSIRPLFLKILTDTMAQNVQQKATT